MKYLKFVFAIWAACLLSCNQNGKQEKSHKDSTVKTTIVNTSKTAVVTTPVNDKEQIQILIRKVLNWHTIDLLPAIFNRKDSTCTGFDRTILKTNLEKLKESNLFSTMFIENYNQIILTLDKKIKNNEFAKWQAGDLPTFAFANDVDPWTLSQDVPYDEPNALDYVEVTPINLNSQKGELIWKWGNLQSGQDQSWKDFSYKFNVEKENGVWKISYLQGFDYKYATQKDGI